MIQNKTFNEAQTIVQEFYEEYRIDRGISKISKVEVSKISVCDQVVFPPLELDETVDFLCLLVTMKDFSINTVILPSIYMGVRVYYRKKPERTSTQWAPLENNTVTWTTMTQAIGGGIETAP